MSSDVEPSTVLCHVLNVSKLIPHDTLRKLFSMIGPVVCCDIYPNLDLKDGSVVCEVIYANISDALLATKLSPCQFGDRSFNITLDTENEDRINLSKAINERHSHSIEPSFCKTMLVVPDADSSIQEANNITTASLIHTVSKLIYPITYYLVSSCPIKVSMDSYGSKSIAQHTYDIKNIHGVLFEFRSYEEMLKAISAVNAGDQEQKLFHAFELVDAIDVNVRKLKLSSKTLYGVPISKLLEVNSLKTKQTSKIAGKSLEDHKRRSSSSHRHHSRSQSPEYHHRHRSSREGSSHRHSSRDDQRQRHRDQADKHRSSTHYRY